MRALGLALLALAALGAVACGSKEHTRGTCSTNDVDCWILLEDLPPAAVPGARVFASTGCLACHTYLGTGRRNFTAPDLSAVGLRRSNVAKLEQLLVSPPASMPSSRSLGKQRVHQLAVFLAASKGAR